MTPDQTLAMYRQVIGTFRATKAPAAVATAVRELRTMALRQSSPLTLEMAVKKRAEELSQAPGSVGKAQGQTLVSVHELVKFVADAPEGRARNRVLNSLDRANAIRFFGPVRNESKGFKQAVVEQVAADAASLAPVRPEVLAGKIKLQQKVLRTLDAQIKTAKVPAQKHRLTLLRKERLKEAAALVTAAKVKELQDAKRFKPFDIKTVGPSDAQARAHTLLRRLKVLDAEIKKLAARIISMKPGTQRTVMYNKRAKLLAERSGIQRRLKLLRQGRDKVQIRRVVAPVKRPKLMLHPSVTFRPAPDLVAVLVRYLAQRLPRRKGESRQQFLLRLRIYVQRALARYAVNAAAEPNPAAAAEAAAVATITDDSQAIESEVDAGGVGEDDAADAMAETVEEYLPQIEQAAADFAPETVENSAPEEFVSSDTMLMDSSLETIDEDLEDAFETLDIDIDSDFDDSSDPRPWFKNPVVWGGAALAALLILRR